MILLTGGHGRLGTELRKLREYYAPTVNEMDITDGNSIEKYCRGKKIDLILHAAAYTDVDKAEGEGKSDCFSVNVCGTINLKILKKPIIYISTEYVFDGIKGNYKETDKTNPIGYYARTKLMGEEQLRPTDKILRLLFKPNPWPYEFAYENQYTSGDYVDIIAKEVDTALDLFDSLPHIVNIGTGKKSMLELAKRTKKDVKPNILEDKLRPNDTSLDLSVWEGIKNGTKRDSEGSLSDSR